MKKFYGFGIVTAFIINTFLYFFRADYPELRGDEAAPYLSLIPFMQEALRGHLFPTFLVYFHEPLQLIGQIPVALFGLSEFWARMPNIIGGCLTIVVLYKIGRHLFGDKSIYTLILLTLYSVSGFFLLFRLVLGIGIFSFFITLFMYYLIKERFVKAFVSLFLATFVFLDAIFLIPGIILLIFASNKPKHSNLFRNLTIYISVVIAVLTIWFITVFLASALSGSFDWRSLAPYRIFHRGSSLSFFSWINNFEVIMQYNTLWYSIVIVTFLSISVFNAKMRPIWFLFLGPFIFFNLVKTPTVHLYLFYPLALILITGGIHLIIKKLPQVKIPILALLFIVLVSNLKFVIAEANNLKHDGSKIASSYFQKTNQNNCSPVYTNIDGYKFRLYYNSPYTGSLKSNFSRAVVENGEVKIEAFLKSKNFRKEAEIGGISIYKLEYTGKLSLPRETDYNFFKFDNILTYIKNCR